MDWPRDLDGPVTHPAFAGSPVQLLLGRNGSRYPFCTTLWINDGDGALLDPGCSLAGVKWAERRQRPGAVYSSHYHFDHNRHVPRYRDLPQYLPPQEVAVYESRVRFAEWIGVTEIIGKGGLAEWERDVAGAMAPHRAASTAEPWLRPRSLIWHELVGIPKLPFAWDTQIKIGSVVFIPRHFPGHSAGNAVFEFPDLKTAYVGDFDLVGFGPWYGSSDSDPMAFLESGHRLMDLRCNWFVTAHQKGVVPRDEFLPQLEGFLRMIEERHDRVRAGLDAGLSPRAIASAGLLYRPAAGEHDDGWKRVWDMIAVKRHAAAIAAGRPARVPALASAPAGPRA